MLDLAGNYLEKYVRNHIYRLKALQNIWINELLFSGVGTVKANWLFGMVSSFKCG